MNYLAEIKAFYDRLELNPQPNTVIALWHALMSIANKAGWPDTFTVAQSVLGLRSGLNASALKRARNKLATDGFIEWKQRGGNLSAQYRINSLVVQNQCKNEPQSAPQSEPQFEPQSAPQSEPINKTKTKTKTDSPPISPAEEFERFWAAYPNQMRRQQAERAFCELIMSGVSAEQLISAAANYAEAVKITGEKMYYPGNFLQKCVFEDYLPENYKPPSGKKRNANSGMMRTDYGDLSELEKELLSN